MDYTEKPKRQPREKAKRTFRVSRKQGASLAMFFNLVLITTIIIVLFAFLANRPSPRDTALYEARITEYNAILAEDPDNIDAYIDRGFANRSLGRYEQANADFMKAIEIEGEGRNFRPLVGLGMVQDSLRNYDAALNYHNRALAVQRALGDSTADPYYRLGNTYDLMGEREMAIESYQHSIDADPDYPNSYAALGNIYYKQKRYAEALEHYERYIDLQGADSYTYVLDNVVELRKKLGLRE